MAFLNDLVIDNGLAALSDADELHITSSEISVYANLAAATLGNKAPPSVGAVQDRTGGGRERVIAAVTDGSVTGSGTASHWCLVDTVNSRVLAANSLSASQGVTSGNTFTLDAIAIGIPDGVSA